MNKLKIVKEYVKAVQFQSETEFEFHLLLKKLNPDNYSIGLSNTITKAYSTLVKEIIGKDNWEWLQWWMWECDFGKKPESLFWINDVKYDASGMVFNKFWFTVSGA